MQIWLYIVNKANSSKDIVSLLHWFSNLTAYHNPLLSPWKTQISRLHLPKLPIQESRSGSQNLFNNFKNMDSYWEPLFPWYLGGLKSQHITSYRITSQFLSFSFWYKWYILLVEISLEFSFCCFYIWILEFWV